MYTPLQFALKDRAEITRFMLAHSFATIVAMDGGALEATHIPLLWRDASIFSTQGHASPHGYLIGHLARQNPIWNMLARGNKCLAIFSGPHAYVSPNYYVNTELVPTWLYTAVHVVGTPAVSEEPDALHAVLDLLTAHFESGFDLPWSTKMLSADRRDMLIGNIIALQIDIAGLEAKYKLDQPRKEEDRQGVIAALKLSSDSNIRAVAEMMERSL